MSKTRRISLYGGPGCGKSTTSTKLFSSLKDNIIHKGLNLQVELVTEYIKSWAWEGRKPIGFDQFYICAKQMRREEIPLRNGVDLIVTDSPLLLQCMYAAKNEVPGWKSLTNLVKQFEQEYPSLHIFLERGDRPYVAKGRYENHEQAKEMDDYIKSMLEIHTNGYKSIGYSDINSIENAIFDNLNIKR